MSATTYVVLVEMIDLFGSFVKRDADEVTGDGISSRFARGPVSLNQGLEGRRKHFTKDRKSTRLNSSHSGESRMPSSA